MYQPGEASDNEQQGGVQSRAEIKSHTCRRHFVRKKKRLEEWSKLSRGQSMAVWILKSLTSFANNFVLGL